MTVSEPLGTVYLTREEIEWLLREGVLKKRLDSDPDESIIMRTEGEDD